MGEAGIAGGWDWGRLGLGEAGDQGLDGETQLAAWHGQCTTPPHLHNPSRHPALLRRATLAPLPTPAESPALRMLLLTHPRALSNTPGTSQGQNPKASQGIVGYQVMSRRIYFFALQENSLKPCSLGRIPACPCAAVSR